MRLKEDAEDRYGAASERCWWYNRTDADVGRCKSYHRSATLTAPRTVTTAPRQSEAWGRVRLDSEGGRCGLSVVGGQSDSECRCCGSCRCRCLSLMTSVRAAWLATLMRDARGYQTSHPPPPSRLSPFVNCCRRHLQMEERRHQYRYTFTGYLLILSPSCR